MTRSLVEEQFGAHARAYATSPVHAKGESLARLVDLVSPRSTWVAVDVATGAGHMAAAIAPHVARVVATDVTVEMLAEAGKLAAARGLRNMETAKASADRLPFATASVDLVTCRIAAHHFPDPQAFLAEAARILKPGGLLALDDNVAPEPASMPDFPDADVEAAAAAYNAFEALRDPSHARALTLSEWLALIKSAGLGVVHSEVLMKLMEFEPWARRIGADAATMAQLAAVLDQATGPLRAYLGPRTQSGKRQFTLSEAIVLARKPE